MKAVRLLLAWGASFILAIHFILSFQFVGIVFSVVYVCITLYMENHREELIQNYKKWRAEQ
ncbi:MAG: hypothetical protein PHQ88_08930 [Bacteroides sp.]|nr:hypothetical protein [Bacteroides sp.]